MNMDEIRKLTAPRPLALPKLRRTPLLTDAVAFAVLANECVHGNANNLPSVTGASHPVVMGKISL